MTQLELFSAPHIWTVVHLLSFGLWFGTMIWHSLIAGIIMFKNMERRPFGGLQAKLFGPYHTLGNICGFILLLSYYQINSIFEVNFASRPQFIKLVTLNLMLVINAIEAYYVSPKTTNIMYARWKAEDEGDEKKVTQLSRDFSKWHGINSAMNLVVMIAAIVYTVYLAQKCWSVSSLYRKEDRCKCSALFDCILKRRSMQSGDALKASPRGPPPIPPLRRVATTYTDGHHAESGEISRTGSNNQLSHSTSDNAADKTRTVPSSPNSFYGKQNNPYLQGKKDEPTSPVSSSPSLASSGSSEAPLSPGTSSTTSPPTRLANRPPPPPPPVRPSNRPTTSPTTPTFARSQTLRGMTKPPAIPAKPILDDSTRKTNLPPLPSPPPRSVPPIPLPPSTPTDSPTTPRTDPPPDPAETPIVDDSKSPPVSTNSSSSTTGRRGAVLHVDDPSAAVTAAVGKARSFSGHFAFNRSRTSSGDSNRPAPSVTAPAVVPTVTPVVVPTVAPVVQDNRDQPEVEATKDVEVESKENKDEKLKKRRKDIFDEIISTEEYYISVLDKAKTNYCAALMAQINEFPKKFEVLGKPFTEKHVVEIFGNISEIYKINSELLLTPLKGRQGNYTFETCCGDIFCAVTPFLRLYIQYSGNFDKSIDLLNKAKKHAPFQDWLDSLRLNLSNPNELPPLDSVLIAPIQRIPRYGLLLKDLLNHTPESHPDHRPLQTAIMSISAVAEQVNSAKKGEDMGMRLAAIDASLQGKPADLVIVMPQRVLVRESMMTLIMKKDKEMKKFDVKTFLFNDSILICRTAKFLGKMTFIATLPLIEVIDVANIEDAPGGATFQFNINMAMKCYSLLCSRQMEKTDWLHDINDCRDKQLEIEGAKMQYKMKHKKGAGLTTGSFLAGSGSESTLSQSTGE
ncbi:hypothetical protein PROFUN_14365 [Planoprotostelium fungivorum]|uniref:DH domain-containing protein n=1 Tax=Planoprotostelium fungivorum TaxID=1890364 RepID=A0A2P6N0C7_9EUKA|nr:hypothetical protein PROFUN_14365 [Planoprotostelium fungivorum]